VFGKIVRVRLKSIFMRKICLLLAAVAAAGLLGTGCANTDQKLGRGMSNTLEIVRMGELRRSMEQSALFESPDIGYTKGFVRGMRRTLTRTGIGIYEIVTFPFPPYDPVATDYFAPNPVYPDNYTPQLVESSTFATDTNLGFSGGDVHPIAPGSRFRIFDTH
jgi:putative exosortase-associated protein (TIGR04073 family)